MNVHENNNHTMLHTNATENAKQILQTIKDTGYDHESIMVLLNVLTDAYNAQRQKVGVKLYPVVCLQGVELNSAILTEKDIIDFVNENDYVVPLETIVSHFSH